jgi:hypothetical protein
MIALLLLGIFIAVVFGKGGVTFVKGVVSLVVGLTLLTMASCMG